MKTSHWFMLLLSAALVCVSVRLTCDTKSTSAGSVDGNPAIDCIMTRTSVRNYAARTVPDSIISEILKAGMAAPTAANQQPWEFIVVTDRTLKDSITNSFEWTKMVSGCQFAVVVCGNEKLFFEGDRRDVGFWVLDCSAASENMLLAAHALGLGGVWCGIYPVRDRERLLSRILNLPSNLIPLNILAFGYPAATPSPKDKWDPSKIHYNAF